MIIQNTDQLYFNDFMSFKYGKIVTKWQLRPKLLLFYRSNLRNLLHCIFEGLNYQ